MTRGPRPSRLRPWTSGRTGSGLPTPPEATGEPPDGTASWPSPRRDRRAAGTGRSGDAPADDTGGFTPEAGDRAPHDGATHRSPSPRDVVRCAGRELPMVYILILRPRPSGARPPGQEDATLGWTPMVSPRPGRDHRPSLDPVARLRWRRLKVPGFRG